MAASYFEGMSTVKTTIYLDAVEYRRLKGVAAAEGRSTSELIRTAVSEYLGKQPQRPLPTSLGMGRSGDRTLGERMEDLMEGFGES
jgi:hypothetical protein